MEFLDEISSSELFKPHNYLVSVRHSEDSYVFSVMPLELDGDLIERLGLDTKEAAQMKPCRVLILPKNGGNLFGKYTSDFAESEIPKESHTVLKFRKKFYATEPLVDDEVLQMRRYAVVAVE